MSKKVKLVLVRDKKIRGKEYKAGTVIFEGECAGKFEFADLEKAIQLGDVEVDPKLFEQSSEEKESAGDQNQKNK